MGEMIRRFIVIATMMTILVMMCGFFFGCSNMAPQVFHHDRDWLGEESDSQIKTKAFETKTDRLLGYDVLGVARYCKEFLAAPKLPAMSTLLSTFGDPLPCVEKRIKQGGLQLVQVDLIDATCWRNNVCTPGAPRPDDLKVIEARAKQVNQLAIKYPAIQWWLSPGLEHDVKDANTVKAMCAAAVKGCPTCKCINSPFSGAKPPGIPLELHGTTVVADSVSADGKSVFDADTSKFPKAGKISTFAWFNELNLRFSGEKTFTPPMQRKCMPTTDLFRQAYMVMQPVEPKTVPPAVCKNTRDVLAPEILKSNAESYCQGGSRDNKPLLITSISGGGKLNILNAAGKVVGCFAYYGPFLTPNLYRWYVGGCSNQTPVGLYDALKSEWGYVDLGHGNCLRINAIRRLGSYR